MGGTTLEVPRCLCKMSNKPCHSTQVWQREEEVLPLIQPIPLIPMPTRERATSPAMDHTVQLCFLLGNTRRGDASVLPEKNGGWVTTHRTGGRGGYTALGENKTQPQHPPLPRQSVGTGHFTSPGSAAEHQPSLQHRLLPWPPAPRGFFTGQEAHDRSQCHTACPERQCCNLLLFSMS